MATITVPVDDEVAIIYNTATEAQKEQIHLLINIGILGVSRANDMYSLVTSRLPPEQMREKIQQMYTRPSVTGDAGAGLQE